jgi:hypothetical protein
MLALVLGFLLLGGSASAVENLYREGATKIEWANATDDTLFAGTVDTSEVYRVEQCDAVGVVVGGHSPVNAADSIKVYVDASWDGSTWKTVVSGIEVDLTSTKTWQYYNILGWTRTGGVGTSYTEFSLAEYLRIRLQNYSTGQNGGAPGDTAIVHAEIVCRKF